jgi:hypothetical protein
MTAYTARAFTTDKLQKVVNETGHGFSVGNILKYSGTDYELSQANTFANSQAIGMVSTVNTVDQFVLTQVGYITDLPADIVDGGPLIAGGYYYLSTTNAGKLTATKTMTDFEVVLPCFIADSATSGWFMCNDGIENTPGGAGFVWNVATVNTFMSVDNGYVINGAGTLTMTLPATSNVGNIIEIAGSSAGGWIVAQTDQTIFFGNMSTTPGAGGSLASTVQYDTVKLLCITASPAATWLVLSADGNIIIV